MHVNVNPFMYIMLKKGQTYFTNLTLLTPQNPSSFFLPLFNLIFERANNVKLKFI